MFPCPNRPSARDMDRDPRITIHIHHFCVSRDGQWLGAACVHRTRRFAATYVRHCLPQSQPTQPLSLRTPNRCSFYPLLLDSIGPDPRGARWPVASCNPLQSIAAFDTFSVAIFAFQLFFLVRAARTWRDRWRLSGAAPRRRRPNSSPQSFNHFPSRRLAPPFRFAGILRSGVLGRNAFLRFVEDAVLRFAD